MAAIFESLHNTQNFFFSRRSVQFERSTTISTLKLPFKKWWHLAEVLSYYCCYMWTHISLTMSFPHYFLIATLSYSISLIEPMMLMVWPGLSITLSEQLHFFSTLKLTICCYKTLTIIAHSLFYLGLHTIKTWLIF